MKKDVRKYLSGFVTLMMIFSLMMPIRVWAEGEQAVETAEPVTATPAQTVELVEPEKTTEPAEQVSEPTETTEQAETVETTETTEATETTEPEKPTESVAEPIDTTDQAETGKTGLDLVQTLETEADEGTPSLEWQKEDFTYSGDTTITGFSDAGYEKALAKQAQGDIDLSFPESVTNISDKGFFIDKIKEKLPQGLIGSIHFHGNINYVGNQAFQGNPGITEVSVAEGEKEFQFNLDAFNPVDKIFDEGENNVNRHDLQANIDFFKEVPVSSLTKLTLGQRPRYNFFARAFARTAITDLTIPDTNYSEIQEFTFFRSSIENLNLGTGVGRINRGAFAGNQLKELTIPASVHNIHFWAFMKNQNLSKVWFADGAQSLQIDRDAFNGCNISDLRLSDRIGEMGGRSFANNQIKDVKLPKKLVILGYFAFANNPLVNVEITNCQYSMEPGVFSQKADNEKTLKNVKFTDLKFVDEDEEDQTYIPIRMFTNGLLKSMEIPSQITSVKIPDLSVPWQDYAFKGNSGWYQGTDKVALYRRTDTGYNLNNELADGKYHIVNPVLVDFEIKDQYGKKVEGAEVTVRSLRTQKQLLIAGTAEDETVEDWGSYPDDDFLVYKGMPIEIKAVDGLIDYEHYKLGDKLRLTVIAPQGWEIESVTGNAYVPQVAPENGGAGGDSNRIGRYELILDPHAKDPLVKDKDYGDGYQLGFKTASIKVVFKNPGSKDPYEPYVPPKQDEQETPKQDIVVKEEEIPQGQAENKKPNLEITIDKPVETAAVDPKAEEIVDETIAQGKPELPKTAGLPGVAYGLFGLALMAVGNGLKKKR